MMAQDLNNITLSGRMTKDAEIKTLTTGTNVCEFTVANNFYQGKEKPSGCNFIDCIMFGERATGVYKYLAKGTKINVVGNLRIERWQSNEGQMRSRARIAVAEIYLLGSKKETPEYSQKEMDLPPTENTDEHYDFTDEGEVPF